MYKKTSDANIDCGLAHRSNANKGTDCRLPGPGGYGHPSPDVQQKAGVQVSQRPPTEARAERQRHQMAEAGLSRSGED